MINRKSYSVANKYEADELKNRGCLSLGGCLYIPLGKYKTLKEIRKAESEVLDTDKYTHLFFCKVGSYLYLLRFN